MSAANFVGRLPANPAQHRLWLVDQQGPRGIEFAYPYLFTLSGPLDSDRLERAWLQVVQRHTPLRTTFAVDGDLLVQDVQPPGTAFYQVIDATGADPAEVAEIVQDEISTPFDVNRQWPIRVRLLILGADSYQLLIVVQHIATDGVSMQLMVTELSHAYAGTDLGALPASYLDVQTGEAAPSQAGLAFWNQLLDGAQPPRLPCETGRPARESFSGLWTDRVIDAATVTALTRLANDLGTTFYSALFALLAASLGRLTDSNDVVLGVPFAGRSEAEQQLIGFFVNLMPVRYSFDEQESIATLIHGAGERLAIALEHSLVPLSSIVTDAQHRQSRSINSLLRITLTEEQTPVLDLPGIRTRYEDIRLDVARYELAVDYRHLPDGAVRLEVSYSKDLLKRDQVVELLNDLIALAELAGRTPDAPLLLSAPVRRHPSVLIEPASPVSTRAGLADRWRACVRDHPDQAGVIDAAGSVSFAELDALSAELSHRLNVAGVRPGDPVALACRRSRDFFIALLAVLRTGGYAVLLDADQPPERLARLVAAAGASVVIASESVAMPAGHAAMLAPTETAAQPSSVSAEWADRPDNAVAYQIFTSGTTGQPKGVLVTAGNLLALLDNLTALGMSGPGQRLGLIASLGFDASVQQWSRLFDGATITIFDEQDRLDPATFAELVVRHQLHELDISPRHLDALLDLLLERLRRQRRQLRILIGGEAIQPALWQRLRAAQRDGLLLAWNMYGPTECTVDSTVYPLELAAEPCIGIPLPGVRAYVLDRWLRPVARGVTGMLHLAGHGLALGYHAQPGLTAQRFLADPFSQAGERMYATGDLVRIQQDGTLSYHGRSDDQVKIAGHRVELAELEAAALEHPMVQAAAAVLTTAAGAPALTLYLVGADGLTTELPGWLAQRLPAYLRPQEMHHVPHIPLTSSGKVARNQLRPPPAAAVTADPPDPATTERATQDAAPSTTAEIIAQVWRQVLNKDAIGMDDDFFDLGGHSLLAIRIAARVRRDMNVTLPITSVFEHPRLIDLAEHVDELKAGR